MTKSFFKSHLMVGMSNQVMTPLPGFCEKDGPVTIDGIAVQRGDVITLVKQSPPSLNGWYKVGQPWPEPELFRYKPVI